jgi:hypothetical protein
MLKMELFRSYNFRRSAMRNYKLSISRLISIFVVVMIFMACSFSLPGNSTEDTNSLTILISDPLVDFTVSSGEEISITSTAFSESGVSHVELLVNDQVFEISRPQDPDEQTYVAILSWAPTDTGIYRISVTVEDLDGQRAESDQLFATVETQAEEQSIAPTATDPLPAPTDTQAPAATPEPSPTSGGSIDIAPIIVSPIPFVFTPNPTSGFIFSPIPIVILPSGPPAVHFEWTTIQLPKNTAMGVSVECPEGSMVTGGGYHSVDSIKVLVSRFEWPNGWFIYVGNYADNSIEVMVAAVCLSNSGGDTTMIDESTSLQGNQTVSVNATCPAGSVVTGGGFLNSSRVLVHQSSMAGNGWQVVFENTTSSEKQVTSYVLCLSGTNATSYQYNTSTEISASTQGSTIALCQPGQLIIGGGFYQSIGVNSSVPIGPNVNEPKYGWGAYAFNPYSSGALTDNRSITIQSYAVCLDFP